MGSGNLSRFGYKSTGPNPKFLLIRYQPDSQPHGEVPTLGRYVRATCPTLYCPDKRHFERGGIIGRTSPRQ